MTKSFKAASDFASRFSIQIAGSMIVGPALCWLLLAVLPERISSPIVTLTLTCLIGFVGAMVLTGAYLINRDNRRLKDCAYDLHSVNHIYRDALSASFAFEQNTSGPTTEELLSFEQEILVAVTQKISSLFFNLVGRKCVVTVKLAVVDEQEGEHFCFTWARSEARGYREELLASKYSLNTGANSGLDQALVMRNSQPSHFFSPDLWIDKTYKNESDGWQRLYRSTIVVPIRHVIDRKTDEVDLIGFLCVDTLAANRLNDTYCVEYLAAFADQMYNFMSIIRDNFPSDESDASADLVCDESAIKNLPELH